MQKLLVTLLLMMLMIPVLAQEGKENTISVPDLTGMSAPQAETALNEQGLRLAPSILSLDTNLYDGIINTVAIQSIIAGEIVERGTIITISVIRDFDLLLLYDIQDGDADDFTLVNLSNEDINLAGIVFQSTSEENIEPSYNARDFSGGILPAERCFQLWGRAEAGFYEPEECDNNRLLNYGIVRDIPNNQKFWQDTVSFMVMQDGVYRASCEVSVGRCELWVSPRAIAEDVTEYIYFIYDEHQLYIFNSAPEQWMPLTEIQLADSGRRLNDPLMWSSSLVPDIDFLAPKQCVRFSDTDADEALVDCLVIAASTLTQSNIFWSNGFSVQSLYQAGIELTCPRPSERSFCLIPRYELNS
jgi:PASTA domain